MVEAAQAYLARAIGESTRGTYRSAVNSLMEFCVRHGLRGELPVSTDTLCLWMADAAQRHIRFSSIRVYLHGIATSHVELGHANPIIDKPVIWRLLKGIKRTQGAGVTAQRLPMTTALLTKLEPHQKLLTLEGLCIRAAMCAGTCGLLRSGEFAHRNRHSAPPLRRHLSFHKSDDSLVPEDSWRSATYMKLRVTKSKTDPFRVGTDVVVSNDKAIAAMCDYLQRRGRVEADDYLFTLDRRNCLTVTQLVHQTQALLNAASVINARLYKGHSFRKGGATSLHEAGMPDSLIRTMGRWKSFAFATYVHTSNHLVVKAGLAMTAARVIARAVSFDPNNVRNWD